jgi:hypothetical protein
MSARSQGYPWTTRSDLSQATSIHGTEIQAATPTRVDDAWIDLHRNLLELTVPDLPSYETPSLDLPAAANAASVRKPAILAIGTDSSR